MLLIISPAKSLDFETPAPISKSSKPQFLDDSTELVEIMRDYRPEDLVNLMGISQKLGELNHERFMNWSLPFTKSNAKQSLTAFTGDVYTGMAVENFSEEDFTYAQDHLRILSGLYGLLRPLDLIQPYRLEMGTKLNNERGLDLYAFWGEQLSKALTKQLKKLKTDVLVNLASNEYAKAANLKELDANIITPIFKDYKNGKYKIVSFFAKKARGYMAAYILQNRLTSPEQLEKFSVDGYKFSAKDSSDKELVFLRKQTP